MATDEVVAVDGAIATTLLGYATDLLALLDVEGAFRYASPSYQSVLGYSPTALLGTSAFSYLHPEDCSAFQAACGQALEAGGTPVPITLRYRHASGAWHIVEATVTSRLTDPVVYGVVVSGRDVTERVAAEEGQARALAVAAARATELEATIESMDDGVIIYGLEGRKLRENRAARVLFGLGAQPDYDALPIAERSVRLDLRDADGQPLPPERLPALRATRGERLVGSEALDLRFTALDGRAVEVNAAASPLRDASGALIGAVAVYRDVTARRRLERQVVAERDRLSQVVAVLPEAILIAEVGDHGAAPLFTLANAATIAVIGFDPVGTPVPLTDAGAEEVFGVRHLDGSPYPAHELPLQHALLYGEAVYGDRQVVRHATTGQERPLLVNAVPLHDEGGAVVGAVAIFQDITTLVELDRTRDAFLSSAAHDLKTPLTTILGHVQLARRRLQRAVDAEALPAIAAQLGQIEGSALRMVRLIAELMDVTRLQMGQSLELERRLVNLVALVRALMERLGEPILDRLRLEATEAALIAEVDPDRLERVIANLVSNADKYSPDGREIVVRVTRDDDPTGAWAVLAVSDHGIGIPASDLPFIFDRFHRGLNVVGHIQGTGIGLASAKQIVEEHGGTIGAESVEGQGSTFTVRLPLVSRRAAP